MLMDTIPINHLVNYPFDKFVEKIVGKDNMK